MIDNCMDVKTSMMVRILMILVFFFCHGCYEYMSLGLLFLLLLCMFIVLWLYGMDMITCPVLACVYIGISFTLCCYWFFVPMVDAYLFIYVGYIVPMTVSCLSHPSVLFFPIVQLVRCFIVLSLS